MIRGHVPSGDLQQPNAGDYAGAVTTRVYGLRHMGLDELTKIYHRPGSGVLQGVDHAESAVDGIIGTGTRDTVDFLDEHLDWPF